MSKKKRNHYLAKSIAINFFSNSQSNEIWEFNPLSNPSIRAKSANKLFSKLRAWNKQLEDTVASVENETVPILKKISSMSCPQGVLSELYCGVGRLDNMITTSEIEDLQRYLITQLMLLRIARNGRDENAEFVAGRIARIFRDAEEFLFHHNSWIIHLNLEAAASTPLVLTDNLLSLWAIAEKYESSVRRINPYTPLTENVLLFWGDAEDLMIFAHRNPTINLINRERIRVSGKYCRFASSNKKYLEQLAISLPNIHNGKSTGLPVELA